MHLTYHNEEPTSSPDRPALPETKIASLPNVREWCENDAVELWVNRHGRLVVKAWNECGNNSTEVDLFDLLESLEINGRVFHKFRQPPSKSIA